MLWLLRHSHLIVCINNGELVDGGPEEGVYKQWRGLASILVGVILSHCDDKDPLYRDVMRRVRVGDTFVQSRVDEPVTVALGLHTTALVFPPNVSHR